MLVQYRTKGDCRTFKCYRATLALRVHSRGASGNVCGWFGNAPRRARNCSHALVICVTMSARFVNVRITFRLCRSRCRFAPYTARVCFFIKGWCPSGKAGVATIAQPRLFFSVHIVAGARQRVNGFALAPLAAVGTFCFRCSLLLCKGIER